MQYLSIIVLISLVQANSYLETRSNLFKTFKSIKICNNNLDYVVTSPTTPCIFLCLSSEDCAGFKEISSTASNKTCLLVKNNTCEMGIRSIGTTVTQDVWMHRDRKPLAIVPEVPTALANGSQVSTSTPMVGTLELPTTMAAFPSVLPTVAALPIIKSCVPNPSDPNIKFTNCKDVLDHGFTSDGVYTVCLDKNTNVPTDVYCDMQTDGGGYMVIQKRYDGSVDFYRNWTEYANGFGDPATEYWLGNKNLYFLTSQANYKLRVEMEDFDGSKGSCTYDEFIVENEGDKFQLKIDKFGGDTNNIGDSLSHHHREEFSTFDQDNDDDSSIHCARHMKGGWWFSGCYQAHLNGVFQTEIPSPMDQGIIWSSWKGGGFHSLKKSEMKLKPVV